MVPQSCNPTEPRITLHVGAGSTVQGQCQVHRKSMVFLLLDLEIQ